mmetsp:Transcript_19264/g.28694  ORF Transcript_19264/g.28694 Transcript_19264/m.28694 type:complete len:128 (+) Transcript_19264:62-445(+)|eukprot:CAMPEP_0201552824 /NCGR_PEP_ID=MMETSP0173_2-20130828/18290_1 /ASSEMBLY_ACC=CAM_ASM_000268 /TAXON_ID=218659 /ORGANISM="Vexillifera sp., Strain DIVA3 564/2" /LENGTH=127 /DNA_ID=CAMNT_0047963377 /DNA_START=54 /DNA_END=437 /DNA_ORIENTATION=+
MATSGVGVQHLLNAENAAQQKIETARNERSEMIKSARSKASADVDAYRAQREQHYQQTKQKIAQQSGGSTAAIQQRTEQEIEQIRNQVGQKKDEVIALLLQSVTSVCKDTEIELAKKASEANQARYK